MPADQHDRIEPPLELLQHAERMPAPAADQASGRRQILGQEVPTGAVCVLDDHRGGARLEGARR